MCRLKGGLWASWKLGEVYCRRSRGWFTFSGPDDSRFQSGSRGGSWPRIVETMSSARLRRSFSVSFQRNWMGRKSNLAPNLATWWHVGQLAFFRLRCTWHIVEGTETVKRLNACRERMYTPYISRHVIFHVLKYCDILKHSIYSSTRMNSNTLVCWNMTTITCMYAKIHVKYTSQIGTSSCFGVNPMAYIVPYH